MDKLLVKIEKYARARTQTHVTLVAFAGGYLLYLVYDMVKSFLEGTGESSVLLYFFVLLFIVCGALFCGGGLYALWKGWYKENTPRENPENSEDENPEEPEGSTEDTEDGEDD